MRNNIDEATKRGERVDELQNRTGKLLQFPCRHHTVSGLRIVIVY